MFKCKSSGICIHLENTCDSTPDCPQADDEIYCDLKYTICPSVCKCLLYTVLSWNIKTSNVMIQTLFTYPIILIKDSIMQDVALQFHGLSSVIRLSFTNSGIKYICSIVSDLQELIDIDFSFNHITKIDSYCFSKTVKIKIMDLKHNKITNICRFAFLDLIDLKVLNLAFNELCTILENSLAGPRDLEFLSVKYNSLLNIKISVINIVNAKYIDINNFYICCSISRDIFCNAKRPSYVSCLSLMQKAHSWFSLLISFIILFLNVLSVILYLSHKRTQKHKVKAFHLIVTSLSTVDLTLGLYLLIIWFADSFHKEHFVMKAFLWKSDRVCFLSYALLLNFNMLSPVLLLFLAFSRFFVVIYPLKSTFLRSSTVFLCILMQYLMVGMITASFTIFKKVQHPLLILQRII